MNRSSGVVGDEGRSGRPIHCWIVVEGVPVSALNNHAIGLARGSSVFAEENVEKDEEEEEEEGRARIWKTTSLQARSRARAV